MIPWEIEAREFANCNCDFGCPCQFNALPTHGDCAAFVGLEIDNGHFGDVRLDGLRAVGIMKWPGPIHFGKGEAFLIVDERANEAQRNAILTIMTGGETSARAQRSSAFSHLRSKRPSIRLSRKSTSKSTSTNGAAGSSSTALSMRRAVRS